MTDTRRYRCTKCGGFVMFLSVWGGPRRKDDAGKRGDCRRCGLDVDVKEEGTYAQPGS